MRVVAVTGFQACALPIRADSAARSGAPRRSVVPSARRAWADKPQRTSANGLDRKSVVEGKSVDLGGRRIIKKKKNKIGLLQGVGKEHQQLAESDRRGEGD